MLKVKDIKMLFRHFEFLSAQVQIIFLNAGVGGGAAVIIPAFFVCPAPCTFPRMYVIIKNLDVTFL